jgi:tRNA(fMet)-specific endonuclease VapC
LISPLYLLDTNTVAYAIKGNRPGVWARLQAIAFGKIAISSITEAELRYWIVNRPNEARVPILVEEFLNRVPSLPWDSSVTRTYALLRADCKRMGKALSELDMQIAAHALALDLILVTHDGAFRQVPGLRTEDWVAPAP